MYKMELAEFVKYMEYYEVTHNIRKLQIESKEFNPEFFTDFKYKKLILHGIISNNTNMYKCPESLQKFYKVLGKDLSQYLFSYALYQLLQTMDNPKLSAYGLRFLKDHLLLDDELVYFTTKPIETTMLLEVLLKYTNNKQEENDVDCSSEHANIICKLLKKKLSKDILNIRNNTDLTNNIYFS